MEWVKEFKFDPIKPLLSSKTQEIIYFSERDLLNKNIPPITEIWNLPDPLNIIKQQHSEGFWASKSKNVKKFPLINYNLIETWKRLRILIDKYQFNKSNHNIEKACEFVFSCQTDEGDIRGFLANQYTMYYTGAILSLLIKAGYEDDLRIKKAFTWLLNMRQNDGGWVGSPFQTLNFSGKEIYELTSTRRQVLKEHDKTKPFSHNWTGMVLRAFAIHDMYRNSAEAQKAGKLLKQSFFKADNYSSYQHPDNWIRFQFPFWWNNLISALDTLSLLNFSSSDTHIQKGLNWLIDHQQSNGLWNTSYSSIHKKPTFDNIKVINEKLWITLAICKIFKRLLK